MKDDNESAIIFIKVACSIVLAWSFLLEKSHVYKTQVFFRGLQALFWPCFFKCSVMEEWHGCRALICKICMVLLSPYFSRCITISDSCAVQVFSMCGVPEKMLASWFLCLCSENLVRITNGFYCTSGKVAKWLWSSWALWKKQSKLSLSFTIMTLEKTVTSEFPSQNLQSDFSVNIPFMTTSQFQ